MIIMFKIYVFDGINGVIARKAAKSMDDAIAWFKATYPHKTYSCVYEQQTQKSFKKVLTNKSKGAIIITELRKKGQVVSMTTFETTVARTNETKYGIRLVSGVCIWFDTRDDRDMYFLLNQ